MAQPFPQTMDFIGHNAPSRIECEIFDLVVEGRLPAQMRGNWYQCVPDPQFPPMLGNDTFLSGDGMVRQFRFVDAHVDFRQRYVRTERWRLEHAARRSLYGLYRNPYTDDPSVRDKGRGVANTTALFHGGKLLALKEDSRPWELDPHTLETRGEWTYEGKLRSETVSAHPRLDPESGYLYSFGYEAGGLASREVAYLVMDPRGSLVREEWFEAPYCALMHDFVVTREHAVFPGFPVAAELERLKTGGAHWAWDPSKECFIGIMPRDGSPASMRWFRAPPCHVFHFINGYTEGCEVHVDMCVSDVPAFAFMREAGGLHIDPRDVHGKLVRWTFDLEGRSDRPQERVLGPAGDFPRIATRDGMSDYEVAYYGRFDPTYGPPIVSGPVGVGFNCLSRLEIKTGALSTFALGPNRTFQEPVHIPCEDPRHEGYLACIVDRHDDHTAEIQVLEAAHIERGPIARVHLPLRLRCGVHGNWVSEQELST